MQDIQNTKELLKEVYQWKKWKIINKDNVHIFLFLLSKKGEKSYAKLSMYLATLFSVIQITGREFW